MLILKFSKSNLTSVFAEIVAMDLEEKWQRVVKETKIIRACLTGLSSIHSTTLPYVFLGSSLVNEGDTVVRTGKITVDRPMIVLPKNLPQFKGFELQDDLGVNEDFFRSFLLIRGISFPSLKYQHESSTLDVFEGDVNQAISFHGNLLERKEDINTGLLVGPADAWQISVLVYVSILMQNSVPKDLESFLEDFQSPEDS